MPPTLLTDIIPIIEAIALEVSTPSVANIEGIVTAVATLINSLTGNKIAAADLRAWMLASYQIAADLGIGAIPPPPAAVA